MINHLVVKIIKLIISNRSGAACTHICIHARVSLMSGKQKKKNAFSIYPKRAWIVFRHIKKHVIFQHEKSGDTRVVRFFTQHWQCVCVRFCVGSKSCSDITDVQVSLFYPPVRRHVLWFVALHVLLHGGQARAEVLADGALVRRSSVVSAQVLDHSRVVSGPLVTQLTLKWLFTWKIQWLRINLADLDSEARQVKPDSL